MTGSNKKSTGGHFAMSHPCTIYLPQDSWARGVPTWTWSWLPLFSCLKAQFVGYSSVSNNTLAQLSFCWLFTLLPMNIVSLRCQHGEQWNGNAKGKPGSPRANLPWQLAFWYGKDRPGFQRTQIFPFFFLAELMDKCFKKDGNMMEGGWKERGKEKRLLTR